jgi:hypothetical protein
MRRYGSNALQQVSSEQAQSHFFNSVFCHSDQRADRWAAAVGLVATSPRDVRTLGAWARLGNMSVRTLCRLCEVTGKPAKTSLTFARLLRTLSADGRATRWYPQCTLAADPRTVVCLLDEAGLRDRQGGAPPTTQEILASPVWALPAPLSEALRSLLSAEILRQRPAVNRRPLS